MLESPFDIGLWIPKGGIFILVDISKVEVMEKYGYDEEGRKRTKDYAFAFQLAKENGIACIPMSPFYSQKDLHLGEKYIRLAYCKDTDILLEAAKRLQK